MTANRRRIQAVAGVVGHRLGKGRGDRFPDAGLAPSSEALINRHPLALLLRQIAPRRSCPNAPQDAIDDLPIVERGPALASSLRRQKGFEQTPLRFAQVAATQSCLPPRGILESKPESGVNPLCKQRLDQEALACSRRRFESAARLKHRRHEPIFHSGLRNRAAD